MERKKKKILKIIIIGFLCINGLLPFMRDIKRIVMNKKESIEIWMVEQYLKERGYKTDYKTVETICKETRNYDALTFTLMASVGVAESGFDPNAVSDKEAYGLFQLTLNVVMPYYPNKSEEQVKKMLLNPEINTRCALKRLEYLSVECNGNIGKVLTAYHAGISRTSNPPQETIKYLYKIMAIWNDILLQDWWYHIVLLIVKLGILLIIFAAVILILKEKITVYFKNKEFKKG